MHTSVFLKLFPPPKLILMEHAGLDISDDAIRCLSFQKNSKGLHISQFGEAGLPIGAISGGEIKDEKAVADVLVKFNKQKGFRYVKASIPEEKSYLFQTDVPTGSLHAISQNIESKLEENVPLPAPEVVFYFDLLPPSVCKGSLRASVSVVSKTYVETMISIINKAGMQTLAFELVPKAIARAVISPHDTSTSLIVNIMDEKAGIYVVVAGVVCFTSTVALGNNEAESGGILDKEINKASGYWASHSASETDIKRIILVGKKALAFERVVKKSVSASKIGVSAGDVWKNAFSIDDGIPPISMEESLNYAVASGLAMES